MNKTRTIVLIAFFKLLFLNVHSQDSAKYTIGIEANLGKNALASYGLFPKVVISKGKHAVFAGLNFLYGIGYDDYFKPNTAIHAGYRFLPFGDSEILDVYIEYHLNFLRNKHFMQLQASKPTEINISEITITSIENYLVLGFKAKMSKRFYFNLGGGLGAVYYGEKINFECLNGNKGSYNYAPEWYLGSFYPYPEIHKYNNYGYEKHPYKKFIGIFKIGLGLNIYSRNEKK